MTGHVKVQPKSGREATETFLQGTGDVLLSYENEALFAERSGDPVEHVTPPTTFKIENPTAVLTNSKNLAKAKAFNDFLFTPEAQKLWAQAGFRPVDPTVAKEFAADFPAADQAVDDRRPRRLEDGRRDPVQEGDRLHRGHLRQGHVVDGDDHDHRPRAQGRHLDHRGVVPAAAPRLPAADGRTPAGPTRAAPAGSPARSASASSALWLSVLVLLPLAALTVTSFGEGVGGLLGRGHRARRARLAAGHRRWSPPSSPSSTP